MRSVGQSIGVGSVMRVREQGRLVVVRREKEDGFVLNLSPRLNPYEAL